MSIQITRRSPVEIPPALAHLHPVLARVFAARGIDQVKSLNTRLEALTPPGQLHGLDKAVELLARALAEQKRLLIIGDFDADGATSTAVAVRALRMLGAHQVDFLVPNRFEYGYGLTPEIVAAAEVFQPDVIITVDNGISSLAGVEAAKAYGYQVVITDHHLPGAHLPSADAIVNPNQPGDNFPSKNLAGVGVIFYVMVALRSYLRGSGWFADQRVAEPNLAVLLDLVALGTVADVVRLDDNNRVLVAQGMARIRRREACPGILALLDVAKRRPESLVAADLGFAVGPRLNAAGRLEDMALGIHCLLTDDPELARAMALRLDDLNHERRAIEVEMKLQALDILQRMNLEEGDLPRGLCLFDETWHEGVIGILASRIKDLLHRPVIAFAQTANGDLKGSARSVTGLHIRDALDAVAARHPHLISKFGGHAMAAGLSIAQHHLSDFQQAFNAEVCRYLEEGDLQGVIRSDGPLAANDFSLELAELLRQAAPWGQGFTEPLFDDCFEVVQRRIVGDHHLKMVVRHRQGGQALDVIAFNSTDEDWPNDIRHVEIAFHLDINEYQGRRSLQLRASLVRPVSVSI